MANDDLTLKEIDTLVGKLSAIYQKLNNKESGAIVQLETILEKIDPMVINFTAKEEKQKLEMTIRTIENLLKLQQSELESITAKYYAEAKDLAQTLIGSSVTEVLNVIENSKKEAMNEISSIDIEEKLKINYIITALSGLVGVVIGFLIGSF